MEGGTICDVISTGAIEVAFVEMDTGEMPESTLLRLPEIEDGQTPVVPFRPWSGEGNLYGQITVDPEKARGIFEGVSKHFEMLDGEDDACQAELLAIERELS